MQKLLAFTCMIMYNIYRSSKVPDAGQPRLPLRHFHFSRFVILLKI